MEHIALFYMTWSGTAEEFNIDGVEFWHPYNTDLDGPVKMNFRDDFFEQEKNTFEYLEQLGHPRYYIELKKVEVNKKSSILLVILYGEFTDEDAVQFTLWRKG